MKAAAEETRSRPNIRRKIPRVAPTVKAVKSTERLRSLKSKRLLKWMTTRWVKL